MQVGSLGRLFLRCLSLSETRSHLFLSASRIIHMS
jgi:hypothetical protein